jgi:hypothetical protein
LYVFLDSEFSALSFFRQPPGAQSAITRLFLTLLQFERFFPSIEPYDEGRLRIGEAANIYGSVLENLPDQSILPAKDEVPSMNSEKAMFYAAPWHYRVALTKSLQKYNSWDEFFPPNTQNGTVQFLFYTELYALTFFFCGKRCRYDAS